VLASRAVAAAASDDPEPTTDAAPVPPIRPAPSDNGSVLTQLGIDATILKAGAGDRIGLQITRVEPDRPGAAAGLEVGDLIIGLGQSPLSSVEQMTDLARREGPDLTIIVFDKNTKKAVPVPVRLDAMAASTPAPAPVNPAPVNPVPAPAAVVSSRLGLNAEVLSANGRAAIKVIEVKPAGPAGTAGIEVGDMIIGVGRQAITSIEGFNREVEAARGSITLVIRDVNTGRSVPVEVKLDGAMLDPGPAPSTTIPGINPGGPAPVGGLGVSVEPADDKGIPTIRVSQVAPGSAAERAGLKRGDIVESVNDTIIFDPDHFNEVVAKAGRSIKMVVKDARTGRKGPIQIDLGGR
jgi:S1-C subfamily serine protease